MNMNKRTNTRGSALFVSILALSVLMGLAYTMLIELERANDEHQSARVHLQRLYAAEAAIESALIDLNSTGAGNLGSVVAPLPWDQGEFWTETAPLGDNLFSVLAHGRVDGKTRVLEAIIEESGHVFHHALYAGNSSNDPNYQMTFEGTGAEADVINGDVFSGGDLTVNGDAHINGFSRASGTITGTAGQSGVTQPIPDIAGMGYAQNNDVNVAEEFLTSTWQADDAGGSAWQLPATNPAHIFRKNPDDRTTENNTTAKDDFYLEDPYEVVQNDPTWDGTDAYMVSLEALPGDINGINRTYYIDGNLWIHNIQTFSFKLKHPGGSGLQVTLVVSGNIYVSDNIFYDDKLKDALALIAIKDEAVPNSGNIYFGDPRGGTLETMEAFMYAEENFYDTNLSADGSKKVIVNGSMSAGNHLAIDRSSATHHTKLELNLDNRLQQGLLNMPGIPGGSQTLKYEIVVLREASSYQ